MADPSPRDHRTGDETAGRCDADVLPFPSLGIPSDDGPDDGPRLRTLIGDVLRQERHDQRRTLADVADAAAVSLPYLSEVERGVKEVSSDLLTTICDALELELVDVLERSARRLRTDAERSGARRLRTDAGRRVGGSGTFALAA